MAYFDSKEYKYEVAKGNVSGAVTWNKWGYNADIDSAASEWVWSAGGNFSKLSSAETLSVVSTSTNDTNGGTGANSIIIYGIDANRVAQTEVVTLNGTTPVVTSNSWLGVNRVAVYISGTLENNEGTVTLTASVASTVQAEVPAGEGSTQHAFFFTGASKTALMDWLWINVIKDAGGGTDPKVTLKAWVYSFVSGSKYEVFRAIIDTAVENTVELRPSQPFVVGEKSMLYFTAETTQNNTAISVRFSFIETS